MPEGLYEIIDINYYIQKIVKEKGHYNSVADNYYISIEPKNNTLKSVHDKSI